MCGIFGIVDLGGGRPIDEGRFREGLEKLAHRGPDGRRSQRVVDGVMFGHARLSIIDLSDESNQPFQISDRYWLTYNGEIFNYLELRAELEALGIAFQTNGDTEVLLRAYIQWGDDCVSRFNGMWAFAIYDCVERTIFASRDRFGIKPFNYSLHNGQLLFASEIKSLLHYAPALVEPDYGVIANYCRTSVGAQHEQSWFRDVRRLQPGHNLTIDANGALRVWRYWDYPTGRSGLDFDEARRQYGELFEDAVRLRMRSDVPLGITLSSGVDSNSIASVMQVIDPAPHHSFTARFDSEEGLVQDGAIYQDSTRRIDESIGACETAERLGLDAHIIDTDYSDFIGRLGQIVYHLESGNSSPAVIPLMQLLQEARKRLTVVLDGQGADELLAGYISAVIWPAERDLIASGRWGKAWRGLRQYLKTYTLRSLILLVARQASNDLPWISRLQQRLQGFDGIYGPRLREHPPMADFPTLEPVAGEGALARRLREQHSGGLVNLLHYGDAISMANSLEARMPFLDHRLVEFVWPLPGDFKAELGVGKYIHRQAMRGLVDDAILDETIKYGFTTPIGRQFRKSYAPGTGPLDILCSDRCLARGLFDAQGLRARIEDHRSGRSDHGTLLFRLLSVELWFRIFIDGDMSVARPVGAAA
ncbi:asparagine synthase (glutamine-hydrolyzing) [Sphingopyxis sp. R3-92]|uniref:asparagine synthase (glutamine-hydrolyzing) n=1 Tax=Sphingopyxis sp. R3-92 TaxID=3158553 RepID=UPI003EE7B949